jgi:hypothetical protein
MWEARSIANTTFRFPMRRQHRGTLHLPPYTHAQRVSFEASALGTFLAATAPCRVARNRYDLLVPRTSIAVTSSNPIASQMYASFRANHSSTSCTRRSKASTRSNKELCSLQRFPFVPAALRLSHASPRLPAPPPARIENRVTTWESRT